MSDGEETARKTQCRNAGERARSIAEGASNVVEEEPVPDGMPHSGVAAFSGGAVIGALGGLIGLGGAEFRLPLLIGWFRFAALEAVILNKAMSMVVVATALPFRAQSVSFSQVAASWPIIVNHLAGSPFGRLARGRSSADRSNRRSEAER